MDRVGGRVLGPTKSGSDDPHVLNSRSKVVTWTHNALTGHVQ